MPTFRCKFTRTVTSEDTFERDYEADTAEAAQALADEEAEASNMDCPDDAATDGAADCEDWRAADVELVTTTTTPAI